MSKKRNASPRNYVGKKAVAQWRAAGLEAVSVRQLAAALGITEQAVRSKCPIPYTIVNTRGDRRYLVDAIEEHLIASVGRAAS